MAVLIFKNTIGRCNILKELSKDNANPQFTHDLNVIIFWLNGVLAFREGIRIREWVQGFDRSIFGDNVFEIIGDWTASFVNGNTHIKK